MNDKDNSSNLGKLNLSELLDLAEKLKQKLRVVEENVETSDIFCSVLDSLMTKYKNKNQDMK